MSSPKQSITPSPQPPSPQPPPQPPSPLPISPRPSTTVRPKLSPRHRSTTISTMQSLGRALRESLRIQRLRKAKKQQRINQNKLGGRRRSKSVGASGVEDDIEANEISEVGISCVVASDYGPVNLATSDHQAKPIDPLELVGIKSRLNGKESSSDGKLAANKSVANQNYNLMERRRSKDDHDITKLKNQREKPQGEAQSKVKKRFGNLFGSLKFKSQSGHTHLHPADTPPVTPNSSPNSG